MDITSISAVVAASGVIVGVVFAVLQLRNLVKARQTDLIIRLYSTFNSKEFMEAWTKVQALKFKDPDDFVKKYGLPMSENPTTIALAMVGLFFDGIGFLLYCKLVDVELVLSLSDTTMLIEKLFTENASETKY